MGIAAVAEPLVVVTLLFGGAWFNRNTYDQLYGPKALGWAGSPMPGSPRKRSDDYSPRSSGRTSPRFDNESLMSLGAWSSGSTIDVNADPTRRTRTLRLFNWRKTVSTPNTAVFKDRLLSRLLRKFPFLVEAWYWALIYWVYQLGRAFTALTTVEGTVHVARKHALQLIHVEQRLHLFIELPIQHWFLQRPTVLHWINRIYSFIHIPGTILFLVMLYYYTTTRKLRAMASPTSTSTSNSEMRWSSTGPALYQARRRTMATCNLIAFIVFTLWPCMPPRLLSDPNYKGENAQEARSYGFVDTVHSGDGESSVWTTNRFCNQYAAMPSLHFGYSLLVGLTIATTALTGRTRSSKMWVIAVLGMCYPTLILTAIVATANHFILDAVAGAAVCGIAWYANSVLLNLLVIEDYFLWAVRIHKPQVMVDVDELMSENGLKSGLLDG